MTAVIYRGDCYSVSGYARAVRNHMRALIEAGIHVQCTPSRHDNISAELDPFWKEHIDDVLAPRKTAPTIRIWHETPEFYDPSPEFHEIAYTVFEVDKIPYWDQDDNPRKNWVKQLNKMDEVWTASEFCKNVFIDSGVTTPIFVFPHPIDLEQYKIEAKKPLMGADGPINTDKFTVLSIFQWNKRKNPQDLIYNWLSTLADKEDAALVIKTYGSGFNNENKYIQELIPTMKKDSKLRVQNKNIHLILNQLDDEEIRNLYHSCDVFTTTTYGEGFGLPYQEAQACGRPSLYPNATSLAEFCSGWGVEVNEEPVTSMPHIPWYTIHQNWWRPNVKQYRNSLTSLYELWKEKGSDYFAQAGKLARKKVETHSFTEVGLSMKNRLESIEKYLSIH